MKTQEYLVTFKNNETSEVIDSFYINALDINNANNIADALKHDYDYIQYYEISAIVEPALATLPTFCQGVVI